MRKKFMEILHFTRELNAAYVSSYRSKEWKSKISTSMAIVQQRYIQLVFSIFLIDYKFHDKFDNNRIRTISSFNTYIYIYIPETRLIIALKISDFRFDTQWRFIAIRLIVLYLVDIVLETGSKTRTCHSFFFFFCPIRSFPSWFLTRWIISVETRKSTFRKFIGYYISWPT